MSPFDLSDGENAKLAILLPAINLFDDRAFKYEGGEIEPESAFPEISMVFILIPFEIHSAPYTLQA